MKSGIILYVTGKEPNNWCSELDATYLRLKSEAQTVEVISEKTGHFDIPDAWLFLLCKGVKRVVCMAAMFNESGSISLTGRELQLCG